MKLDIKIFHPRPRSANRQAYRRNKIEERLSSTGILSMNPGETMIKL